MDIPYRLDTVEAIHAAKKEDLLNLGKGYNLMLIAARNVRASVSTSLSQGKGINKARFYCLQRRVNLQDRHLLRGALGS